MLTRVRLPRFSRLSKHGLSFSTKSQSSQLLFNIDEKNINKIQYSKRLKLDLDSHLDNDTRKSITKKLIEINNGVSLSNLFKRRYWDIKMFERKNLPIVIGHINNKNLFHEKNGDKFFWLLDLPIKMPNMNWAIPEELSQFGEFISKCVTYEKLINPDIDDYYAYLSVDQRPVNPNESQRRPGWHSDSFITKDTRRGLNTQNMDQMIDVDSIYLAYNCLPTEFCAGPFTFDGHFDRNNNAEVLDHFERISQGKDIVTYLPFNILKMGPECVHRVGFNMTNSVVDRTFIKLVFSREIFNRVGNDHNSLIDYNWPMIPRTKERNNSNIIVLGNDDVPYVNVTSSDLQNLFMGFNYSWVSDIIYQIVRKTPVLASLAREGELLQTELNNSIITYNIAQRGSWKVKKLSNGTEYFLSSEQMEKLYEFDRNNEDSEIRFKPKPTIVQAIELTSPIKIMSPWGHPQYLLRGDFIIKRDDNDIYGIKRDNFYGDYEKVSTII